MDFKYKLSIIIPVYNVEKYIKSCLDSVVNQQGVSNEDYEVVIVNDGSPDRSAEIINGFDWKECPHSVIDQENKGLSGARNTGLKYAKGMYIWFVDSDDTIESSAVSEIIKNSNQCDIINIGYTEIYSGVEQAPIMPNYAKTGIELLRLGFFIPSPFHIYKYELLSNNNIKFVEGILHEDMEFTPRCLYFAKSVATIKKSLYYYQIRKGSIMTTINTKRAFDNLVVANSLISFSMAHKETISNTPMLQTICMSINNAFYIITKADLNEQSRWSKTFNENPLLIKALCASSVWKYKIEGYLFKLSGFNRIKIYNLLTRLKM